MADQICPDCGHDMCRAHWLHLDAHGHVDDAYTRVVTAECRERMSKLIAAKDAEIARLRACIAEVKKLTAAGLDYADGNKIDVFDCTEAEEAVTALRSTLAIIAKHGVENG